MSLQFAARKYANALYDVAEKNNALDAVGRDMASLVATLDAHPNLEAALGSPLVLAVKKRAVVEALLATAPDTRPETSRLLLLLADRDRLSTIRDVAAAFTARSMEAGMVVSAEIVTAVPIDDGRKAKLAEALGHATGLRVVLTDRVDPAIVAGVVATVGGVVYDGSAVRQMELMKKRLVADA